MGEVSIPSPEQYYRDLFRRKWREAKSSATIGWIRSIFASQAFQSARIALGVALMGVGSSYALQLGGYHNRPLANALLGVMALGFVWLLVLAMREHRRPRRDLADRCRRLARDIFDLIEDNPDPAMQMALDTFWVKGPLTDDDRHERNKRQQEASIAHMERMYARYNTRYSGDVLALYDELLKHGAVEPGERIAFEHPITSVNLRRVAQALDAGATKISRRE